MRFTLTILSALCTFSAAAADILYAIDGDSIQEKNDRQARLLCIDAPEFHQQHGKAARLALQKMLRGDIQISRHDTDRHRRSLVLITNAAGNSVNLELVRRGHAWVARRYAKTCGLSPAALFAAEKEARQQRRGLWQAAAPQPPWQWRRENPRRH